MDSSETPFVSGRKNKVRRNEMMLMAAKKKNCDNFSPASSIGKAVDSRYHHEVGE